MDPKSSTQLDPKLQEAYNKVMGVSLDTPTATLQPPTTPAPISDTTTQPTVPSPIDNPVTVPDATGPTTPLTSQSTVEAPGAPAMPDEQKPEMVTTPEPPAATMQSTVSARPQAFVAKKGTKVSPVILVVGAVAFLLVYSLIWIKVFNLSIPFINQ